MSEFNPLVRPKTPPKVAWFEFLLQPSLLEEHLNKDVSEPSACQLISLFLFQADLASATAKEIAKNIQENNTTDEERSEASENKKVKALRALALSVATILKWNLDYLEHGLPLATVECILHELLSATLPGVEPIAKRHAALDLKAITPEAVFSVLLFHRWCLRTAIKDKFPVKPSKVPNVQVPGLLDPSVQSASKKDSILNTLRDSLDDTSLVLEHYMTQTPNVTLPTLQCFPIMMENRDAQTHDWSMAQPITQDEIMCQISYELGTLYFFRQDYDRACQMFFDSDKYLKQLANDSRVFVDIEDATLHGYLSACSGLLGRHAPGPMSDQARLIDAIESIRQDNFEGLTSLLMQDNQKCVLSLSYRMSLEEDVRATTTSERFIQEVVTCNVIRQAMEGRTTPSEYLLMLTQNPGHVEFLIDMATGILNTMSFSQRNNLKYFIRYLCYSLPKNVGFPAKVADGDLKVLFNQSELSSLLDRWKEDPTPPSQPLERVYPVSSVKDDHSEVGQLQHDLLVTYDPEVIKTTVQRLLPITGKRGTCFLVEKWQLPKELHMVIDSLPMPQPYLNSYIYVMVAKARFATQQKMYTEAHTLLQTVDQSYKEVSYKLTRLLRWELLRVDLLQHSQVDTAPINKVAGAVERQHEELVKRCKACLSSLIPEHDIPPAEMTSLVVGLYLLNTHEWDYLSTLSQKYAGHIEIIRQMAMLCKELPQMKNARKYARELWGAVTLIFTNSTQQKRSGSGSNTNVSREGNMGLISQTVFVYICGQIKDQLVLSMMISLLSKLYNNLKDDLTVEISSDYLTLWPTTLVNSSAINITMVMDAMTTLMAQALTINSVQPSWLRTQADIHYAHSQYALAIKFYLELGIVLSDFFSKPITRNIYDENVFRRLIRCCTYLHCHTQVAVLCQFLEEVDYTTAFKALQERSVHDAMDAYYPCIWDITMLEFLANHHQKRGEFDKKQYVLGLIGQMELNCSNPDEILLEAAKLRKSRFLRSMAKEYL